MISEERPGERVSSGLLAWIHRLCIGVTCVCLLFMMFVLVVNVIGRYFFRAPLPSTVETVGLVGVLLISIALFPAQFARRNVSIPIITDRLPPAARKAFDCSSLVLSLVIVGVFIWTGGNFAWEMCVKHETTAILEWPVAPFRFVWTLGCMLLFIILVVHLVERLTKKAD